MPHPAQVSYDAIVTAAETILEQEGVEALSLGRVADALGIKAPSLYRHVKDKNALLRAVNEATLRSLINHLLENDDATLPTVERLTRLALAYRTFAHAHPRRYSFAFNTTQPDQRPDPAELLQLVLPLQAMTATLVGEPNALDALRGLLALMHGYISLELNQQLQRGGDLGATYERIVSVYLQGWQAE